MAGTSPPQVDPAASGPLVVLVPGAGSDPAYWEPLRGELSARGVRSVAVDLPCADDAAGLAEYADAVVSAAAGHDGDVVLVAHSMGAFTAPLVCERLPVAHLVLLSGMIGSPGEAPGDWWDATGHHAARVAAAAAAGREPEETPEEMFYNGLTPEQVELAQTWDRPQSATPLKPPWPLRRWPDVPTTVLAFADDRLFPPGFQRRIARDRLGLEPVPVPGGHMGMVSHPGPLADTLATLVRHGSDGA